MKNKISSQSGAAMIIGIVIITLLILVAVIFAFITLSQKPGPVLTADPVTIKADDKLTNGRSNSELSIDTQIVLAGLERDEIQRKAAAEILADEAQPIGNDVTAATTIEASRLSQLQTEFVSESDRRLKLIDTNTKAAAKLPVDQRTPVLKLLSDEQTAITGLKAKAAAETNQGSLLNDRGDLEKEYLNFILALSQVRLLLWANDQNVLDDKINVLGGKFQERLNEASSNGSSIARAQTALNTYQTSKKLAKEATTSALKQVPAAKPNSFEANRAVLKSYYGQLATAHSELDKASKSAKELVIEVRSFKQ